MPAKSFSFSLDFLKSKHVRVLTVLLLAQAALFYGLSRGEALPPNLPLSTVPAQLGSWTMIQEGVIEQEVQEVLKADDLLTRVYTNSQWHVGANLYIAYFRSQRTGQAPHSPKNCLPGSGWVPSESGTVEIAIEGQPKPIEVNRYIVERGEDKSLVLYWYQTPYRVIASEYAAKIYLVADAIRYNRTDTALVRVVVPVVNGDEQRADEAAAHFVRESFGVVRRHLPA
jgi:EpsI family protein